MCFHLVDPVAPAVYETEERGAFSELQYGVESEFLFFSFLFFFLCCVLCVWGGVFHFSLFFFVILLAQI